MVAPSRGLPSEYMAATHGMTDGDIYRMRGTQQQQNPLIDDTPRFLGFTYSVSNQFFPPLMGLVLTYDTTSPMDT